MARVKRSQPLEAGTMAKPQSLGEQPAAAVKATSEQIPAQAKTRHPAKGPSAQHAAGEGSTSESVSGRARTGMLKVKPEAMAATPSVTKPERHAPAAAAAAAAVPAVLRKAARAGTSTGKAAQAGPHGRSKAPAKPAAAAAAGRPATRSTRQPAAEAAHTKAKPEPVATPKTKPIAPASMKAPGRHIARQAKPATKSKPSAGPAVMGKRNKVKKWGEEWDMGEKAVETPRTPTKSVATPSTARSTARSTAVPVTRSAETKVANGKRRHYFSRPKVWGDEWVLEEKVGAADGTPHGRAKRARAA